MSTTATPPVEQQQPPADRDERVGEHAWLATFLRRPEVGAAVALKPDASATPEELRAFARDKIAAYKYPRQIWLVDELPKGPTGKILRREVKPPEDAR